MLYDILDLHSFGNGFWDNGTLSDLMFLLSTKSEYRIGARRFAKNYLGEESSRNDIRRYALPPDRRKGEESRQLCLVRQVLAGDFTSLNLQCAGHKRLINIHKRLNYAKKQHHYPNWGLVDPWS